jgi:hypothetical protein
MYVTQNQKQEDEGVTNFGDLQLKIGNLEEAKTHFRGLTAMIRGRRGIHSLGYEGLIARLLKAYAFSVLNPLLC